MKIIYSARITKLKFLGKKISFEVELLRNNKVYQVFKDLEASEGDNLEITGLLQQEISQDIVEVILDEYSK